METTLQYQLENFYEVNGYGREGGIDNDWIWLKFKYFSLPIPNLKGRRENVWKHDILHILLEYDTSWEGEAMVSGWTIGSGGWGRFYVAWLFSLSMFGVAVICFPKSTYKAFVRGRNSLNPHLLGIERERLFRGNIEELKHEFGFNKVVFKVNLNDKLFFMMWASLVIFGFLLPFCIIILFILKLK